MNNTLEFTPAPATETAELQNRARIHKAKRRATYRKDGWTAPEQRHETAQRVIRAVIRRIQFPRFGAPVFLSPTDTADAEAAGMLACVQANFFEKGFVTLHVIRAIRNAIQGPACLRMRRTWETSVESPADIAAAVGFSTEFEAVSPRLTRSQIEMAREMMRTLRAAHGADISRKHACTFDSHRRFFLILLGELTGRTARAMSAGAFRERTRRFMDYLATGAAALRTTRAPARLDVEIMRALAARALA